MHRLLSLLVLLASVAAPLVPLDCPLFASEGMESGVHAMHGDGAASTGSAHAHGDPRSHTSDLPSDGDTPADSGTSHHGDTGCRVGSMCGGAGVLASGVLVSSPLLPSHAAVSTPAGGWPSAWPGHDTPPPRLPV